MIVEVWPELPQRLIMALHVMQVTSLNTRPSLALMSRMGCCQMPLRQ